MNCTRWRELASDYIEGGLPSAELAAMREHAEVCAACRRDESVLRGLWRELNVLPSPEPPMFFRDNVVGAIERQSSSGGRRAYHSSGAARPGTWERLFSPQTRWALGGALATAAAAVGLFQLNGANIGDESRRGLPTTVTAGIGRPGAAAPLILPHRGEYAASDAAEKTPQLVVSRTETPVQDQGTVADFTFWLQNASKGTVRVQTMGDAASVTRFLLTGATPQVLRVPLSAAHGGPTLNLFVQWTGEGQRHTKHLFVPVNEAADGQGADSHQAFGLPEMTVVDAAREIAARYGRPVTLEDVPEDVRVAIYARGETASQALRPPLSPLGLTVTSSASGILITPATPTAGEASPAVVDPTILPTPAAAARGGANAAR